MSGDCCDTLAPRSDPRSCPRCGAAGKPVSSETVRALAVEALRRPPDVASWWFCRTPSCGAVYFAERDAVVTKAAVRVRVGLKEQADPIPLCYCFGFTRADVSRELAETGACTIPARITAEVKAGTCRCATENPSGSCCLGEVRKAVAAETGVAGQQATRTVSRSVALSTNVGKR